MGGDRQGKRASATPSHRRRLSDLTNLPLFTASLDNLIPSSKDKELEKEIFTLTKLLSEKDAIIAAQTEQVQKLQREYTFNLHRRAAVNEEIIFHNTRLSKENLQLREQMKILQHEYNQMTSMFRVMEAELRLRLEELEHSRNMLLMDKQMQNVCKGSTTTLRARSKASSTKRHSMTPGQLLEDMQNSRPGSSESACMKNEPPTYRRLSLRSRGTLATKEDPCKVPQEALLAVPKSINRRQYKAVEHEGMDRLCEGDETVSSSARGDSPADGFESSSLMSESGSAGASGTAEDDMKPAVKLQRQGRVRRPSGVVMDAVCSPENLACATGGTDGRRVAAKMEPDTDKDMKRSRHGLSPVALKVESPELSQKRALVSAVSGRPMRKATACIASYKEPPLNTKLRRST